MMQVRSRGVTFLSGLALLLIGAGAVVDFGMIRPRIAAVKQVTAKRLHLRQEIVQSSQRDQRLQKLADFLHVQDKADLSSQQSGNDPLAYLAQMIDQAGLTRLDIGAGESAQAGRLKRSTFSIRVMGKYDRLLALVQALEQGPRFVTIDVFSIESTTESNTLEGRFSVTVYETAVSP
jgi:Tfp pilus assembly protein PilO